MKCCDTSNHNCGCDTEPPKGKEQQQRKEKRRVIIDFLYLDLDVCIRCQGTEDSLEDTIRDTIKILKLADVEVILNKVHINSLEKAIENRLISSPTIRVNGKDIQLEVKESQCESCGDLCGSEVDCRVWVYDDKEYTVPPKAMIINAILGEVYTSSLTSLEDEEKKTTKFELSENLKRFFQAMDKE